MGYGEAATTDDAQALHDLVKRTADDFVIASARANLAMAVADAEIHIVAGDEGSLTRFVEMEPTWTAESVRTWIESHRKYAVDFGVIVGLLRHYEPFLLAPMNSLVE